MRKAKVTYNAPAGDARVVETGGVTFFDGKSVEINDVDHAHLFVKLQTNPHFDVDVEASEDEPTPAKRKPGRPSNAEKAAEAEKAAAIPEPVAGSGQTPIPTVQPIS